MATELSWVHIDRHMYILEVDQLKTESKELSLRTQQVCYAL